LTLAFGWSRYVAEGNTLRIQSIDTFVLRAKLDRPFSYSQGQYRDRAALLVKVTSDSGLVGWGEGYGRMPEAVSVIIREYLWPLLKDEDVLARDVLWQRMYSYLRDIGQKGVAICAISAIDIALWDIVGKEQGRPVHDLLGGAFRREFPAYATGFYYSDVPDRRTALVEEATGYVEDGFKALKLKAGLDPARDLEDLREVRRVLGDEIKIMVDVNHAFDARTAIEFGRQLEAERVAWFEEPVEPENYDGYRAVAHALDIPVAGGEAEFTRYGFRDLISRGHVGIAQPDLCATGGITEARRIATLAEIFGVRCIPHVWGTGVALAAAVEFIAALPNAADSMNPIPPMLEYDRSPNPLREDVGEFAFQVANGAVRVADAPGLGVEVREKALETYLVGKFSYIGEMSVR
jgi:D-galactarolactone cycloisomerase